MSGESAADRGTASPALPTRVDVIGARGWKESQEGAGDEKHDVPQRDVNASIRAISAAVLETRAIKMRQDYRERHGRFRKVGQVAEQLVAIVERVGA